MRIAVIGLAFLVFLAPAPAQSTKSLVGTLAAIKAETAEVEVKPDSGAAVSAKLTPDTIAQRIAPGESNLKNAKTIPVTDLAVGDRVLVTLDAAGTDVRRIVVMSATDISKRNAADRADWTRRGISGIVASKKGTEVEVKVGGVPTTVTVSEKTTFKRYAPDSVKFTDAKPSSLAEVAAGDQLRARGVKSADGLKVEAEEVVFGTFLNKAGTITAVDPEAHEISIKELGSNKPITVKFTADSQLKRMPDMAAMGAMGGMRGGMGAPGGGAPGGGAAAGRGPSSPAIMGVPGSAGSTASTPGAPGAAAAAGRGLAAGMSAPGAVAGAGNPPMGGRGPGAGGPGGRGPASFDISQMIDSLPPAKVEDLKTGDTILVSSTKGARNDQITAIVFLANADALVQILASRAAASGGPPPSLGGLAGSVPSIGQ
jgi:hypothetical protein